MCKSVKMLNVTMISIPTASSISSAKPAALDDCDRVRFLILWQQRTFLAALEVS